MSRIDELIAELCPDGVPFKPLGEIGELVRGGGMPKADFTEAGVGAIHYGQIYTHYGTWTTETISFVSPDTAARLAKVDPGDVIITNTSENLEDVGKAVAWLGGEKIVTGGHATVLKHSQNCKFIAYWLQTPAFFAQKKKLATGTKVIDVSAKALAKIEIPVPPLEVQREIVRILDLFASLEAELEAELEARRRQYAHYNRLVLAEAAGGDGWRRCRLREVCDILVGFPFKSAEFSPHPSDVRLVRGDNIGQGFLKRGEFKRWRRSVSDGLSRYELQTSDVVLAMDRPWIPAGLKWARIEARDLPALLVQRVACLRSKPEVLNQQYLGHVISSGGFTEHVLSVQTGNTVPHLSERSIAGFLLPVPPLEDQARIVAILDKFDALVNDLSVGLPAELAARRKQYEHYRDRLLTFEEAVA